jgi:iron complex outermembrane recepter protein
MKKLTLLFISFLMISSVFSQTDSSKTLSEIQVVGIRPLKREPITITNIKEDTFKTIYQGKDPFFIINRLSPNVLSQSDNGFGNGYCYIRIRGLDQTRINFTLNGIPMNEMEDQGIYFSNMPGFLDNVSNIQIQRGVGSSKYGTTSFAGSVDMETRDPLKKEIYGGVGYGSYNTSKISTGYSSGLNGKFAYSFGVADLRSDGFKENSGNRGSNIFGQVGYYGKSDIFKIYGFLGQSSNQQAYSAPIMSQLKQDYRLNLNRPSEIDTFNQNFVSANWINFSNKYLKFNTSAYFNNINGGYTYFQEFDSSGKGIGSLYKNSVNSDQVGVMSNSVYQRGNLNWNTGVNVNYYQRLHFSNYDSIPSQRFYNNYGYKNDYIIYTKAVYQLDKWNLFGDLQYRFVDFKYREVGISGKTTYDWSFFNPKVGIKYVDDKYEFYTSVAKTGREPARSDLYEGNDNVLLLSKYRAIGLAGDTFNVKLLPESVYDFETGGSIKLNGLKLNGNFYYMSFRHELIPTGVMNDIGIYLKKNVDKSTRYGFEFDGIYTINRFSIGSNFSILKAEINKDNDSSTFNGKVPFGSPTFLMNNFLKYRLVTNLSVGLNGQYVSKMWLDNENTQSTPSYYLVNSSIEWVKKGISLIGNVNNLFNKKYYLPGGVYGGLGTYYAGSLFNYFITLKINI